MGCSVSVEAANQNIHFEAKDQQTKHNEETKEDDNLSYDKFGLVCSLKDRQHYEIIYSNCDECDINGKMMNYTAHKRIKTFRKYC
jgi:hypothetical protein